MTYREFMWNVHEYINSLEEPIQKGEAESLTAQDWTDWIKSEAGELTNEQIYWIVEKLEADGFVKEA